MVSMVYFIPNSDKPMGGVQDKDGAIYEYGFL